MKILRLPLLLFLLLASGISSAQVVQWVKVVNGAKAYSVKTSENGDMYLAGLFYGTTGFDSVTTVTSRGNDDIFTAKYSSDGQVVWVRSAGGSLYDEGYSLALTSQDVCVAGFSNNAVFNNNTSTGYPSFIADYDTAGRLKWTQTLSGSGGGNPSVASDGKGNFYMTGDVDGLTNPESFGLTGGGYFLIKFNNAGKVQWGRGASPTRHSGDIQVTYNGITCDVHHNIYVAGSIQGETVWFDSTHALTPVGTQNLFVVKYDSLGNVIRAIQNTGSGWSWPQSIAVDTAGNIYVTGYIWGQATFGDTTLVTIGGKQSFTSDTFTAKYFADGKLAWVRQAGVADNFDSGCSVKVDAAGNVYVVGLNSMNADFGEQILQRGGAFLAKYSNAGRLLYVTPVFYVAAPTWGTNFIVNDFALGEDGSMVVTGYSAETMYFDSGPVPIAGMFLIKLRENATAVAQRNLPQPAVFQLDQNYPNPFNPSTVIRYSLPHRANVALSVYNSLGQQVAALVNGEEGAGYHEVRFNANALASGVYFYRLQAGSFTSTKAMLVVK